MVLLQEQIFSCLPALMVVESWAFNLFICSNLHIIFFCGQISIYSFIILESKSYKLVCNVSDIFLILVVTRSCINLVCCNLIIYS